MPFQRRRDAPPPPKRWVGVEWVVDASGCDPARLASRATLAALWRELIADLDLHPIGRTRWQLFPSTGGITGFALLAESHLAWHTFPELGYVAVDLYCCRPRRPWPWRTRLAAALGAREVRVRTLRRSPRGGRAKGSGR